MRTLAVDIGTVRIGFAISDPLGITAQPLPTQPGGGVKKAATAVCAVIRQYEDERHKVGRVVIGNPLHMDGRASEMSDCAASCAQRVTDYCRRTLGREIPVELWDERLSSVAAEKALLQDNVSRSRRRDTRDQVAAQLILSAYLEAHRDRK